MSTFQCSLARIRMRKDYVNKVTCNIPLNDSDPALIAPTIATKPPPPPSREPFQAKRRRLKKINSDGSSESETAVDLSSSKLLQFTWKSKWSKSQFSNVILFLAHNFPRNYFNWYIFSVFVHVYGCTLYVICPHSVQYF